MNTFSYVSAAISLQVNTSVIKVPSPYPAHTYICSIANADRAYRHKHQSMALSVQSSPLSLSDKLIKYLQGTVA